MVAHEVGRQQVTGVELQQLLLELEKLRGDWGSWETFVLLLWLPLAANSSLHKLPQSMSFSAFKLCLEFLFCCAGEKTGVLKLSQFLPFERVLGRSI